MCPFVEVIVSDMNASAWYEVYLEFVRKGNHQYKFDNGEWQINENAPMLNGSKGNLIEYPIFLRPHNIFITMVDFLELPGGFLEAFLGFLGT